MRGWRATACVMALAVVLAGCSRSTQPVAPAAQVPELPQAVRARLGVPGIHEYGDRSLVVGTLHYHDLEGGFWAVDLTEWSRTSYETTRVVIANPKELHVDLQALDGQYVGAAGRLLEGPSTRMAGPELRAEWIAPVDDLAHASPQHRFGSGLYTLDDGRAYAAGWLERHGAEGALFFSAESTRGTPDVLVASPDRAIANAAYGGYIQMYGAVPGARDGIPLFEPSSVYKWRPGYIGAPPAFAWGPPLRWRHVEPPGLKDLPAGRKRVVGLLQENSPTSFTVRLGLPWTPSFKQPMDDVLLETSGTVLAQLRRLAEEQRVAHPLFGAYVALEGRLDGVYQWTPPPGFRGHRGPGLVPPTPILAVESVTVVTTMAPTADELRR